MRARGVEPLAIEPQTFTQQRLKENNTSASDRTSDSILQKHPELASIIRAWPTLSKNYREAILETVHVQTGCEVE